MLFNSISYAVYLPIVFLLYWFVFNKSVLARNAFLIVVGYFFYGLWDWRFLFLLLFSSLFDFMIGLLLRKSETPFRRKVILLASITVNLGLLGTFKYFDFFAENFTHLCGLFGLKTNIATLHIILPVGISFYTFQSLSYVIDVYRRRMNATTDLLQYMAFVSFFPQLVAGPIMKAVNFLPEFSSVKKFDYALAADGMKRILWGLFKKVVVADNIAGYVDQVFTHSSSYPSATLITAAAFFLIQIYADFSGYSDIATGSAQLFGFRFIQNFSFPLYERNIADFWRKWHISLSSWFRDYVYIPLGGNRKGEFRHLLNLFFVFALIGLWHGAKWTFVMWGVLNAVFVISHLMLNRKNKEVIAMPRSTSALSIKAVLQMLLTFILAFIPLIFFRSDSVTDGFLFIEGFFRAPFFTGMLPFPLPVLCMTVFMIVLEWMKKDCLHALFTREGTGQPAIRYAMYFSLAIIIGMYFGNNTRFIYFQF